MFVLLRCFAWLVWLCARVELGGLKARCVFAPVFIVLQLFFFFFACFPALLVLFAGFVYLCYLCGSLGVLLVLLFPLRTKRKKGRNFLRPLLSCCGLV